MNKDVLVADGKTMKFRNDTCCGTLLTNGNFTGTGVQIVAIPVGGGLKRRVKWKSNVNK